MSAIELTRVDFSTQHFWGEIHRGSCVRVHISRLANGHAKVRDLYDSTVVLGE